MRWYQRFFRRKLTEKNLDAELRFHLEQRIADLVTGGMTQEEARRRARLEFGGLDQVKEECRDVGASHIIETVIQDLRYGLRQLRRNPGFTTVAILTLALGIGANTAIFSMVNAALLRPLPYPESNRLVELVENQPHLPRAPFAGAEFLDYDSRNRSFEKLSGFRTMNFILTGQALTEWIHGAVVSSDFFAMLGVHPLLGRDFLPEEGSPGARRVALLTYGFWQNHFGASRGVVGRSLTLNDQSVTVVGVLPASFNFRDSVKLYLNPRNTVPAVFPNWKSDVRTDWRAHYLEIFGRLKPGVTLAQAQADLNSIAAIMHQDHSSTQDHQPQAIPLRDILTEQARQPLLVLLGAVGLVLLICCANVANLLLARAAVRQREIGIRSALGASGLRLVRQLLAEGALLAALGGALGLALAYGCVRLLVAAMPHLLPRASEAGISVDPMVLAFTVLLSFLAAVLFGLAPASQLSHRAPLDALKETGRDASGSRRQNRLRGLLVVAEVAMSVMLLIGAGLLIHSFVRLLDVKPGFNPENLATMWFNFEGTRYAQDARITGFVDQLLERVRALPGVQGAAIANDLPLEGDDTTTYLTEAEGHTPLTRDNWLLVGLHAINSGYFQGMGIQLLRGREFSAADNATAPKAVIINQKLAATVWPQQDPIGKYIVLPGGGHRQVVGVVANVLHNGLGEPQSFETYLPFPQSPWSYICLAVRTDHDPGKVFTAVRELTAKLDPDLPVHDLRPMDQVVADSLASRRLMLDLTGTFAALALLLAAIGLYGVISYSVARRTHEIGIRMALGAEKHDVLNMVVWRGLKLALIGAGIGIGGALALTRFLSSLLYGVKPTDPLTFISVSLILTGEALVACYIPARRAAKVDPMVALRYE